MTSISRITPLIRLALFSAVVIAVCWSGPSILSASETKKQVLVLNSYHQGLSWTDTIVRGIESVIPPDGRNYEIDVEYMDTKRHLDQAYLRQLALTYKRKYEKSRFDVVIVSDNDALDFARQYGADIFRDAPVVFCGINDFTDVMLSGIRQVTGVVEETDVRGTIEIALRLHPATQEVVVVNDRTTTGIAMKNEVLKVIPEFQHKVRFVFFDDFDIGELQTGIRNLPTNSLVLLMVVNQDKKGNFFAYEESLAVIRKEANVPIYSVWDFYLGNGIVGGMLTSAFEQGKTAATLALRILQGEHAADIPIVRKSPNRYMFDYAELQRFRVRQNQLPAESTVVNVPDSFFVRYRNFILGIVLTIGTLSVIVVVQAANIVQRRRIERALRESEEKYRDLYDNAPDMYHSVDANGTIIDCNETEATMLGYQKSELIGRSITDIFSPETQRIHEREFPVIKQQRSVFGLERDIVRKDGTVFPASLNVFMEFGKDGSMVKTRTIMRDMTERKRVEEQLRNSQALLRNLSAHLQSVREEERRQIATEIHDELGQILTALKLDLSWLRRRLDKEKSDLSSSVQTMMGIVDRTIEVVQRISAELRPGVLDYLGLEAALEWQGEEFRKRSGIECDLTIDAEEIPLDRDRATAVFRIFQEALTNVIRHAGATKVQVRVSVQNGALAMKIQDNGKGITDAQLSSATSFGIIGIRERVRFLGGDVHIVGVPEAGTVLDVTIPLEIGKERQS
ncbi:MAG TPA: ABC transporter substrate binding protein [Dissulfurispiraceae bacterium]|nr:ABC transporter substrate binding protein [Dissulfurispiraceae bacterium]